MNKKNNKKNEILLRLSNFIAKDQELKLILDYQKNKNSRSINKLLDKYKNLIWSNINKFRYHNRHSITNEFYLAESIMALHHCIVNYDMRYNKTFGRYLKDYLAYFLKNLDKKYLSTKKHSVMNNFISFDESYCKKSSEKKENLNNKVFSIDKLKKLNILTKLEKKVLYLLNLDLNILQICNYLNKTKSSIYSVKSRISSKMTKEDIKWLFVNSDKYE